MFPAPIAGGIPTLIIPSSTGRGERISSFIMLIPGSSMKLLVTV